MRRPDPSKRFSVLALSLFIAMHSAGLPALAEALKKPLSAREEFSVGQLYFYNDDYPQAVDHFSRAIKADPENGQYFYERGHAYFRLDDYIQAAPDFTRSLQLKYMPSWNYERRGFCYLHADQLMKGIDDYSEAIKADPRSRIAYLNRAKAYLKIGDIAKYKADVETIKQLDRNPRAKDLCDRAQSVHNHQERLDLLTRAVALDPKFTRAMIMLGATYLDMNRKKEALDCFNKLIAQDPANLTAVVDRGLCLMEFNSFADGIKDLSAVIAKAPQCFQAYYWRGDCYRGLGQQKEALADYNQAIDLIKAGMRNDYARKNREYRNALGKFLVSAYRGAAHSHEKMGDLNKAIEEMSIAINGSRMAPHDLAELLPERAAMYKLAGRDEEQHRDLLETKRVMDKIDGIKRMPYIPPPKMHDEGEKNKKDKAPNQPGEPMPD